MLSIYSRIKWEIKYKFRAMKYALTTNHAVIFTLALLSSIGLALIYPVFYLATKIVNKLKARSKHKKEDSSFINDLVLILIFPFITVVMLGLSSLMLNYSKFVHSTQTADHINDINETIIEETDKIMNTIRVLKQ